MTKKIVNLFSLLLIAFVTLGLAGCLNEELKVSYKVQNDQNEWVVVSEKKVVNGEAELIDAPEKQYYNFAGWFTDEALSTPFTGKDINKNISVFAKYTLVQVKVIIDGKDQGLKNLIDVVNATYKPDTIEGLEFDGWYKDAACKVSWDKVEDVTELYAQNVALVTYTNGYETLTTEMVKPGTVLGKPSERVIEDTNFEAKYIVKDYMSAKNLSYFVNDEAYDFSKEVVKSMEVLVKWNSNISDGSYKKNPRTGNYYIDAYSLPDAPVVSFLSNVSITVEEDGAKVEKDIIVEGINPYGSGLINTSIKKMIFGEGLKFIKGVTGEAACNVSEVVLPSTLKIIDGSFNNMPLVKEFNIPEGVEIIIGSFWGQSSNDYKTYYLGTPTDFEINIPASVKNMSMVPNNLKFAEGSNFEKVDGKIILNKDNEKILISDPVAYESHDEVGRAISDTIVVPEGITGIQVGTYDTIFNYLILPTTFKFINYNEKISEYDYYVYMEGSSMAFSSNMLYDETAIADPSTTMGPNAYTITHNLGGFAAIDFSTWQPFFIKSGKVVFASEQLPENLDAYAFATDTMGSAMLNGKYQPMFTVTEKEDGKTETVFNSSLIFKDTTNIAYITLYYAKTTVNLEKTGILNKEEIQNEIFAKLPDNVQADLENANFKFLVNGKEVTLGEVTEDMFITVEIVEAPCLKVNSSFRLSCDDSWTVTDNPEEYTQDYYVSNDVNPTVTAKITDLTGLSKDSIINAVIDAAVKKTIADYAVEEETVGRNNIKWSFDNALSIKVMMNDTEVTDYSKINLDNGTVTLDLVVEYAPYAA